MADSVKGSNGPVKAGETIVLTYGRYKIKSMVRSKSGTIRIAWHAPGQPQAPLQQSDLERMGQEVGVLREKGQWSQHTPLIRMSRP